MSNYPPEVNVTKGPARVGILVNGASTDAVSELAEAVNEAGFSAVVLDTSASEDLFTELRHADLDVALLTASGEALGCLQGLLEALQVPYTGSNPVCTQLCQDRVKSKEVLRYHNVPTLPFAAVTSCDASAVEGIRSNFGLPVSIRVRVGGERFVASCDATLTQAVESALARGAEAVVERTVSGVPYDVAILDGRVLGARPRTERAIELGATRLRGVLNIAEQAAEALGCRGAVLVEMLVSAEQNEFVTHVETLPALTAGSPFAQIAHAAGFRLSDVCTRLMRGARLDWVHSAPDNLATLPAPVVAEPVRLAV